MVEPNNNSLKEWALYYASLGLAVFPLKPKGKAPAINNGFHRATTDPKQIKSWWENTPDFNIGIATGQPSGLLAIDLDIDDEKGVNGYEILKSWQQNHGALPDSWQSITGRGGYHLIYGASEDFKCKTGLYEGVDIRANGGYIVAPPSLHPNGRCYEWETSPGDCPITPVNDTVKAFLNGGRKAQDERKSPFELPNTIPEGQRVSTLVSLIGKLKNSGLADETIKVAVREENELKCSPPCTSEELEKEVFPALTRGWKAKKPYTKNAAAVLDNGRYRAAKENVDFSLSNAADVEIKEPEWLISGYIPRYGITTIAGEGGTGKTSIWCALVASITTGQHSFLTANNIPFGSGEPENVLIFSAEDSWSYVLRNRLEANGADLSRISFLSPEDDRFTDLNFDSDLLKGIIIENRPSVIIFDPLQAFIPANLKMGDRNAMRKCFSPLMGYGEQYGVTSIIIAHANKQSGVWGRKRIADSSDIWDGSRSVLMVGTCPDSNMRYISQEKSNYGRLQDTVLYTLNENCVPVFESYSEKKDRDFVLAEAKEKTVRPAVEDAKDFILETLKNQPGEKMAVADLDGLAKALGVSCNSLKNAKTALSQEGLIKITGFGFGKDKVFTISLTDPGKINE